MVNRSRIGKRILFHCNISVFQILVLRDIGGCNIDEFVRRAMPFMITNSLAMRYNMSGLNGKMCFKNTIFWELIYGKDDVFIRNEINFPHM